MPALSPSTVRGIRFKQERISNFRKVIRPFSRFLKRDYSYGRNRSGGREYRKRIPAGLTNVDVQNYRAVRRGQGSQKGKQLLKASEDRNRTNQKPAHLVRFLTKVHRHYRLGHAPSTKDPGHGQKTILPEQQEKIPSCRPAITISSSSSNNDEPSIRGSKLSDDNERPFRFSGRTRGARPPGPDRTSLTGSGPAEAPAPYM